MVISVAWLLVERKDISERMQNNQSEGYANNRNRFDLIAVSD